MFITFRSNLVMRLSSCEESIPRKLREKNPELPQVTLRELLWRFSLDFAGGDEKPHQLRERTHPELLQEMRAVQLRGAQADAEIQRDHLVGLAVDQAACDVHLARRQRCDAFLHDF